LILFLFPTITISQDFTHGTVIVIVRAKDTIFVSADSRVQTIDNRLSSFHTCKIRVIDDIGIASAGLYADSVSGFSTTDIAIQAASTKGTIFQKFQTLERIIREPLISTWANIHKQYPLQNMNDLSADIAFFGFYQDVPFVLFDMFYPVINSFSVDDVRIVRAIVPKSNMIDSLVIIPIGQYKEILDAIQTTPFSTNPWTHAVNKMVQIAIDKRTDVGAPIDLLIITRSGKKWIQKKQECPD
jgi:hypothetical protein